MAVFVSFIRGINVGGNKMIRMDALKAIHESLGCKSVRTHLQSGNVVFEAPKADPKRIEKAIEKAAGMDVRVVVRTPAELRRAIERNPFPEEARSDPSHLVVIFLEAEPEKSAAKALVDFAGALEGPEKAKLFGSDLYVYYGANMARSKLSNAVIEKKLGVAGTARNWNTVAKMLEMAESLEG